MKATLIATSAVLAATACDDGLTPAAPDGGAAAVRCAPDLDGRITADELPIAAAAAYLVSAGERAVDLSGPPWALAEDAPGDQKIATAAIELDERWYAERFPGGQVARPVDRPGTLEAIYSLDGDALWLHGLASREPEPPIALPYRAPVPLVRLPLVAGASWDAEAEVDDGVLYGLPYRGTDSYQIEVDGAAGELALPHATFTGVLRMRTSRSNAPSGAAPITWRQVSFFAECQGELARAVSRPGEPTAEFDVAAEIWRRSL